MVRASRRLAAACGKISFHAPVAYVYNPLQYARAPHEQYIRTFGEGRKRVMFLGMNPGPWGMAQTGVPFGEVSAVRDWMGINGPVHAPPQMHPRVTVKGFATSRAEVSGTRLWGLMRKRFGGPEDFFRTQLVVNYCPLLFLDLDGRNLTPDKLTRADRQVLERECDAHLRAVIKALEPEWLVGVGKFAVTRLEAVRKEVGSAGRILGIPHPSPASPLANRDWAGAVTSILCNAGVWSPLESESPQ